jgi:hypothetical protein
MEAEPAEAEPTEPVPTEVIGRETDKGCSAGRGAAVLTVAATEAMMELTALTEVGPAEAEPPVPEPMGMEPAEAEPAELMERTPRAELT